MNLHFCRLHKTKQKSYSYPIISVAMYVIKKCRKRISVFFTIATNNAGECERPKVIFYTRVALIFRFSPHSSALAKMAAENLVSCFTLYV